MLTGGVRSTRKRSRSSASASRSRSPGVNENQLAEALAQQKERGKSLAAQRERDSVEYLTFDADYLFRMLLLTPAAPLAGELHALYELAGELHALYEALWTLDPPSYEEMTTPEPEKRPTLRVSEALARALAATKKDLEKDPFFKKAGVVQLTLEKVA
jgi:hypothetical protein